MEHINFLEPRQYRFTYWVLVISFLALLGVFSLIGLGLHVASLSLTRKLTSVSERVELLRSEAKQKGENAEELVAEKPDFIQGLEMQIDWAEVIHDIGSAASQTVWLDTLKAALLPAPELELSGNATSSQAVGAFVKALRVSEQFKNVVLIESMEKQEPNAPTLQKFKVKCEINV
jgi:Tfp pilus assembly protein PilN